MDTLSLLAGGFATSLLPLNLVIVIVGVAAGLLIGAMPGLGPVNGVAIVLPLTFLVPPTSAMIFLAALYYGSMYGGAIASILLGIPGDSAAVATTFDGRPMALQGKAAEAVISAAIASFIGGTSAVILFTIFAAPLADVALAFGPAEEFALVLLAFTTFVGLGGDDVLKTIAMICLGLVLATVGLDMISGQPRMVFFDLPGPLRRDRLSRRRDRHLRHRRDPLEHRDLEVGARDHAGQGHLRGHARDLARRARLLEDADLQLADRLLRRHPAGGGRHPRGPDVLRHRQEDVEIPADLRQGQHRGRARAGDRQQRRLDRARCCR